MEDREAPPGIDTSRMHPARRYDYWLGGKDNFPADRASADLLSDVYPAARIAVVENRAFLRRAVAMLARDAGIRQFLDIGSGIPTAPNVHEIAQAVAPESRVVYVDNDPIVQHHAKERLIGTAEGTVASVNADLCQPDRLLGDPALTGTLDMTCPVGLLLVSVLHFITDDMGAYEIVDRLVHALPSGSYLVMSHGSLDLLSPEVGARLRAATSKAGEPAAPRTEAEFARFFTGMVMVPPGIVPVGEWRREPDSGPPPERTDAAIYAAVGRIA